ncbi:hypothetical protein [Paracidovorax cattleyae]|uniref:Uncharacterized protein n=2 Tax=Paracidovorax cattleyae TaxID=80868 RepID=A0A1H0UB57_9BURK|nr:hypothetical protein [Paracidovorax cattleyae]AVS73281.1 hypothetical protein C8240_03770 [Paracidovorax cattleyae]MBF9264749.1 hypothetical protein [Paracidovorax cattleyae]SDP63280.1 hypothetical protein SAMN04489708_1192 [Paracidovorax cattleyae]
MRHAITHVSRTLRAVLVLVGLLAAIPCLAAPLAGDPAFTRPDPVRLPDRSMLRAFLDEIGQTRRANTFCFVQQRLSPPETAEDGTSVLSMLWHEGARVYLVNLVRPGQRYQPVEDSVGEGRSLASSSGSVDLKTGVAPTEADVGSSTTLVSRAWVERLKARCRQVGTTIRVPAFTPRRTP